MAARTDFSAMTAAGYSTHRPTRGAVNFDQAEWIGFQYAPSHTAADGAKPARFPDYSPIFAPPEPEPIRPKQRPRLNRAHWTTIAERVQYETLRDLAVEYGVSHETIRGIVQRVSPGIAAVPRD